MTYPTSAMRFEPSNFTLSNPPLAIVLAQFSLRQVFSQPILEDMRSSLRSIGLERLTRKNERSISFSPGSINPTVRDSQAWILLDSKYTKGLSVVGSDLSCFTGHHSGFEDFVAYLSSIVSTISHGGTVLQVASIALRYINVFEIGNDPTIVVKNTLGGLDRTNLGKEHHHHNYEFWCDTDHGRLTLRFSTAHGDRKPAQLGHAEAVFPTECLRSYDETVGHLDIFTNTTNLGAPVNWEDSKAILKIMNMNIEQAFLNAINESALVERFGAKVKHQ